MAKSKYEPEFIGRELIFSVPVSTEFLNFYYYSNDAKTAIDANQTRYEHSFIDGWRILIDNI